MYVKTKINKSMDAWKSLIHSRMILKINKKLDIKQTMFYINQTFVKTKRKSLGV